MRNVRMELTYDGSQFFGWQRQDGFETVQQALEEGLVSLLGQSYCVQGAGRTDTGVHALAQVAHCHLDTPLDDDRLRHAWNAHLMDGVVINRLETCPDDFHSRFSARGKRYLYVTSTTRFRSPIGRAHSHWTNRPLDLGTMRQAGALLVGRHDFVAFSNSGSPRSSTVRTVRSLHILARQNAFGVIVEGDGFLYNMVRTLAGTLLAVGRGRIGLEQVERALSNGNRLDAGPTAPACGLYLLRVLYPETIFVGRDRGVVGAPGLFQV